jgi:hypothetical protein
MMKSDAGDVVAITLGPIPNPESRYIFTRLFEDVS